MSEPDEGRVSERLRGNFQAKLDSQGRLKIPRVHRATLEQEYGTTVWVSSYNGESVIVYPMSIWLAVESWLESAKDSPEKMQFLLNLNYFGHEDVIDGQGRIAIPSNLREWTDINGEVAVIGQLNHLVVWNNDRIREHVRTHPLTPEVFASLAELGRSKE